MAEYTKRIIGRLDGLPNINYQRPDYNYVYQVRKGRLKEESPKEIS